MEGGRGSNPAHRNNGAVVYTPHTQQQIDIPQATTSPYDARSPSPLGDSDNMGWTLSPLANDAQVSETNV